MGPVHDGRNGKNATEYVYVMAADTNIEQANAPEISYARDGYARGKAIPWWAKMWIKIILAALPVPYRVWKRLGLFQHGEINTSLDCLYNSFDEYCAFYKDAKGAAPRACLELGPGDSIGHALCAKAQGVEKIYLVDAGDFASTDDEHYRALFSDLKAKGAEFKRDPQGFDRDNVLSFSGGEYLTNGLYSMPSISADSIDLSFSQAVFEHIPRDEFGPYMQELFRVHKSGSVSRHWVDLHDHLGGALNNMRFSPKFWESKWVHQAGFYTNRLTMQEMIDLAGAAGFRVEIQRVIKWKELEPSRGDMNALFQSKSEDELNVCTFLMVMEKE